MSDDNHKAPENLPKEGNPLPEKTVTADITPEYIGKCTNCGGAFDKRLKPLYCMKCGKILEAKLFAETPSPSPSSVSEEATEPRIKRDEFFCPRCHTQSLESQNPVFCITCGFRFPRDIQGKILIDPERYAFMPDNQPHEPISPMSFSPQFHMGTPPSNMGPSNMPGYQYPRYFKPKTWSVGAGIGVPLLTIFLQTVLLFVIMLFSSFDTTTPLIQFIMGSASLFFLIIPVLWVQRYYPERKLTLKERLKELGLNLDQYTPLEKTREILMGVLFGALGVLAVLGLQELSYWLIQAIYNLNPELLFTDEFAAQFLQENPATIFDLTLYVLNMLLFVGFSEEIMFRGFVQRSFETKLTKPAAILLTAIYFSLFHIFLYILSPPLFLFLLIPYLGVSLILGLLRFWRKDLLCPSVMHIVYNSLQTIIIFIIFF